MSSAEAVTEQGVSSWVEVANLLTEQANSLGSRLYALSDLQSGETLKVTSIQKGVGTKTNLSFPITRADLTIAPKEVKMIFADLKVNQEGERADVVAQSLVELSRYPQQPTYNGFSWVIGRISGPIFAVAFFAERDEIDVIVNDRYLYESICDKDDPVDQLLVTYQKVLDRSHRLSMLVAAEGWLVDLINAKR